jgi:hypothetical protein
MQLRLAASPDPDLSGAFGDCKGREVGYPKRRLVKPCVDGRKIEEVLYDDHVQLHF